ncbi:MAG: hypothetical protein AB7E77_08700 [Desulfobulbus sp.]
MVYPPKQPLGKAPSLQRIRLSTPQQIPASWGKPREAVRKTTVTVREPQGVEPFTTGWGELTAVPGEDLVIIQDSGEQYPIKQAIFAATYEETAPGRYRKKTRSRLVRVPPGVVAVLVTPEGEIEVRYPDYVVIGVADELYANAAGWVEENLAFLS